MSEAICLHRNPILSTFWISAMSTSMQWPPPSPSTTRHLPRPLRRHVSPILSFRLSDFDGFAQRVKSGEAWRGAWKTANNSFEQLIYETRKAAERIDRRFDVSRKISEMTDLASHRARELDRDYAISQRWRTFTLDFGRNWPRYRRQLNDLLDTPVGRSCATIFFLWFALSGWLFRVVIFSLWVLPFAGPLLIGAVANNLVIKGECPACKRQFAGYKNQTVRCSNCGNIVWQPQSDFSGGSRGTPPSSKTSQDIIDVEFEEK